MFRYQDVQDAFWPQIVSVLSWQCGVTISMCSNCGVCHMLCSRCLRDWLNIVIPTFWILRYNTYRAAITACSELTCNMLSSIYYRYWRVHLNRILMFYFTVKRPSSDSHLCDGMANTLRTFCLEYSTTIWPSPSEHHLSRHRDVTQLLRVQQVFSFNCDPLIFFRGRAMNAPSW